MYRLAVFSKINMVVIKEDRINKVAIEAVFHCSRFARTDTATDFNLVKNQSRGHAKKIKCQETLRLDTYSKS